MTPPPDPTSLSPAEKDALIAALLARIDALTQELAALRAENAALRAKLGEPPKTPGNSSTPPSQGHKAGGTPGSSAKSKPHAGAHRPLHPSPTRRREVLAERCPHCRADVSGAAQAPVHAYDRIEIPEITPDITRVVLHGGVCPAAAGGSRPRRRRAWSRARRGGRTCAPSCFTCASPGPSRSSGWRGS